MKQVDKLRVYWSRKDHDIAFHWPGGMETKSDARYLDIIFSHEFLQELTARGYDIRTMKFSIEPAKGNAKFTSQKQETNHADKTASE